MKQSTVRFYLNVLIILALLLIISPINVSASKSTMMINKNAHSFVSSIQQSNIYLPLVIKKGNPPTILGAESDAGHVSELVDRASEANLNWIRVNAFSWKDIEPVDTRSSYGYPTYDWSKVSLSKLNYADRGMKIIATIKNTPSWAQKVPPYSCGPIKYTSLDEFAEFVTALIERYGSTIKYWQFGNEPDVDPSYAPLGDNLYGCWGNKYDTRYYGGGYYAQMLEIVYPAIKAADPEAQVVVGGLLLNCDPGHPPQQDPFACQMAYFTEGILENNGKKNGGNYFDVLAFHGYGSYYNEKILDDLNWGHRGGIILGKVDFLRTVMAAYGVNKPILLTETSLMCPRDWTGNISCGTSNPEIPPNPSFFEAQADYVFWVFVRTWAAGLEGSIWYKLEESSWRFTSLMENGWPGNPKPAFYSLRFLSRYLTGATYVQQITTYPEFAIYEFHSYLGNRIWIIWSSDQLPHNFPLPAGTLTIFNKYGDSITPVDGQIVVNSPVYVEFQ